MDHWQAIQLAREYVLRARPERALEMLEHAWPENPETCLWRANALHQLERYEEAADCAQLGLDLQPDASYLHHALARAKQMLGQHAEAEAAILESLRLNPEEPEAIAIHASILSSQGKRRAASKVIRDAANLAPDVRTVRLMHAMMNLSRDDETAIRISRELLEAEPDGAAEHWWHGMNLVRRGRLRDAADHFARASAIEPANPMFAGAARVAHHWFFWPLRVTSPVLYWLAAYSIVPLLLFAWEFGGVLWPAFWGAVAWSAYSIVYLLAHRFARDRSSG